MCRSIKQLRRVDEPPTEAKMRAAALQYVRKVSGYRKPSRMNQAVFERAVDGDCRGHAPAARRVDGPGIGHWFSWL